MKFQELITSINEKHRRKFLRILHAVLLNPGISRSSLIKQLDLSKNNITDTINAMLDKSLLCEKSVLLETSCVGRPPIGLFLPPDLFYMLGAVMTLEEANLVLTDANNQIIDSRPLYNEGTIPQRFLEEIRQKVTSLLKNICRDRVMGIGAALPGVMDFSSGQVFFSQAFWNVDNLNLKTFFNQNFELDSFFINVSHIHTVMEKMYGGAKNMDNFITVNEGLGIGMFFNGQLYQGWQSHAGELGYMKITEDKNVSIDGRNGLLYDRAIFGKIGRQIVDFVKGGGKVKIDKKFLHSRDYVSVQHVVSAVENGDKYVAQLLRECFSYIGDAIVNVAYLLNPEAIFFPQWTAGCPECTVDIVREKMRSYGCPDWPLKTKIMISSNDSMCMAKTAAYLFAKTLFEKYICEGF